MKQGRVTLGEVARVAGVSRATVSLVVRKSPLVAKTTRAKVEQVMEELDYVRDIGAARLRNNKSHTIGVIIPNLVNTFFTQFLAGIEQVMSEDDRVVLLANSDDDHIRQSQILQQFRGHGVDGVILCPADKTDLDLMTRIQQWNFPLVQSLREVGENATDFSGVDFAEAAELAVRHLVEQGHQRIAFLSVYARTSARLHRLDGFNRAIAETGVQDAGIVEAGLSWDGAAPAARKVLELKTAPTAILCFNDVLAAGLMLGLREMGREPGRDIAVVGIDDLVMAKLLHPTLTTVAMFPEEIGAAAARLLRRRLNSPDAPLERTIIRPSLMIRDSSAYCSG